MALACAPNQLIEVYTLRVIEEHRCHANIIMIHIEIIGTAKNYCKSLLCIIMQVEVPVNFSIIFRDPASCCWALKEK